MKYIVTENITCTFNGDSYVLVTGDIFQIGETINGITTLLRNGEIYFAELLELKDKYKLWKGE